MSKARFRRVENLTLEFEMYGSTSEVSSPRIMIGFVNGETTSYSYCQTPSNLIYFNDADIRVYENCGDQSTSYSFDARNAWWRFKIVLKGTGARYYVFRSGVWNLIRETTNNNQNDYEYVNITFF